MCGINRLICIHTFMDILLKIALGNLNYNISLHRQDFESIFAMKTKVFLKLNFNEN